MKRKASSTNHQITGHFILIGNDAENLHGHLVGGYIVSKKRLETKIWPLYEGTRNRSAISKDDVCLLYLAGKGPYSQHFIARMVVEKVKPWHGEIACDEGFVSQPPSSIIVFREVQYLLAPIAVQPLLKYLSFIPKNQKRWGCGFQGGCRKINETDFNLIICGRGKKL